MSQKSLRTANTCPVCGSPVDFRGICVACGRGYNRVEEINSYPIVVDLLGSNWTEWESKKWIEDLYSIDQGMPTPTVEVALEKLKSKMPKSSNPGETLPLWKQWALSGKGIPEGVSLRDLLTRERCRSLLLQKVEQEISCLEREIKKSEGSVGYVECRKRRIISLKEAQERFRRDKVFGVCHRCGGLISVKNLLENPCLKNCPQCNLRIREEKKI